MLIVYDCCVCCWLCGALVWCSHTHSHSVVFMQSCVRCRNAQRNRHHTCSACVRAPSTRASVHGTTAYTANTHARALINTQQERTRNAVFKSLKCPFRFIGRSVGARKLIGRREHECARPLANIMCISIVYVHYTSTYGEYSYYAGTRVVSFR